MLLPGSKWDENHSISDCCDRKMGNFWENMVTMRRTKRWQCWISEARHHKSRLKFYTSLHIKSCCHSNRENIKIPKDFTDQRKFQFSSISSTTNETKSKRKTLLRKHNNSLNFVCRYGVTPICNNILPSIFFSHKV